MKLKFLFIIFLSFSLYSCGGAITANLIQTLTTPQSVITTLADFQIEQETGKKVSEHALSAITSKDCKFDLSSMTVCKDDFIDYLSVNVVGNIKSSYLSKIE